MINSFSQKLSNWLPAKSNISTTIDFCCLQVWHFWEQLQRAAQSALIVGIGIALLFPLGDVYCPYTKYSGKLCLHKEAFQSLGRSVYQCPQGASACRVRDISFEEQTSSFFSSFGQEVHILEENSVSIQDVIGALFCAGKYCSNRQKMRMSWRLCNNAGSFQGCGKCGAWLFVQKVLFLLQEHVKTTQTDKTLFFFAKKRWTCYPTNNC